MQINSIFALNTLSTLHFESDHFGMKQDLERFEEELKKVAKDLHIYNDVGKCNHGLKYDLQNGSRNVYFKGQKAFNRIKNALKDIKKQKEMCKANLERLQLVMNETVWRKHGKLKSKKSLRERADNYAKEKEGRRKKYKRKKPDEADKAVISGAPPAKKK
eukprot:685043_1